jgi:branched-chain amino acid transport system substrate-binding protein
VLVADDSGDASTATAEASYADLVAKHADVVIGPASSALAQRLLAPAAPDAVVLVTPDNGDLTKALITALSAAGLGGGRLWLTGQNMADYSQALPGGLLNGVNGILDGDAANTDPGLQARLKGVRADLGSFSYAAETYDAVILAAVAAQTAHANTGPVVAKGIVGASARGIKCGSWAECADALRTTGDVDYDGVSGTLNLDATGGPGTGTYGVYAYNGDNQFARTGSVRA